MWELDYKESWAPKNWCLWIVVLKKTLESPLDCKEIQPIHPKEISPEYSLEGLMQKLKFQYFGHLMQRVNIWKDSDAGINWRQRRSGWQRMRWLDGITNSVDMNLGKLRETVRDREAWCAAVPGVEKNWTRLSDWTEKKLQVHFSCSVVSDSLRPHGLQHSRLPCPSPTPGAWSNSCPLSGWCHSTISSSVIPFSSHLQSFPASGSFPMSVLHIRWPNYWSISISPSKNIQDWLVGSPCSPRISQESSATPQFKSINP